ncbi:hypothetical protein [Lactococcus lactis]|uniref:Apea-like HEPN domain-containing protein n=2 Tax=Lactococcus lactis TaxID=1358 RepID=A0AB35KAP4_9LACT|nr:hypothetical protein [Lactococcus lactis]MDG4977702.1 hypothetical protein [Lactococcus lactis]MDG5047994.1 hypothetical protein [Lactococcus lactis]
MFNYKVCLVFKKNDTILSQELNVENSNTARNRMIKITKVITSSDGLTIFFCSNEKITDFTEVFEMVTRFKNFMIAVQDISSLNDVDKYEETIFQQNESGNWEEIFFDAEPSLAFLDFKKAMTPEIYKQLLGHMYGSENLPLSYILLKKSKNLKDRRQQFISIMTACEIGVKEFYKESKPDLSIILDNLQSPSIPKLLGSIFKSYFEVEFPKELRKQIQKYVEQRNGFIHSSEKNIPTLEECLDCYIAVLKTLNYLNKINDNYLYYDLYEEEINLISVSNTQARIVFSDLIKERVSARQLNMSTGFSINLNYSKPKL